MYPRFYTRRATEEFRAGKLDVDLWLEALAHAGGAEAEAERLYVRLRAEQLSRRGGGPGLFRAGELIRPTRFLWLYPLVFLISGVFVLLVAAAGMLNPNAVSTGPAARLGIALVGLMLCGGGAWGLRASWRAMRQAQNAE